MIADYEGDIESLFNVNVDGELPILATRNMVLFPGIIVPILIGRDSSLKLVRLCSHKPEQVIAVFCQKDTSVNKPTLKDLYHVGVFARIVRTLEMPMSNNITAIVQGLGRCKLEDIVRSRPFLQGIAKPFPDILPQPDDREFSTAIDDFRLRSIDYIKNNDEIPDESQFAITNIQNEVISANFICSNMPFDITDKIRLLNAGTVKERVFDALKVLHKEMQLLDLKHSIRNKTQEDIDEQQREYFLQQQIKNIKEELGNGENSPERKDLTEKAKKKKWSEETQTIFQKELDKLDTLNPQSPDYSIQINYLQTFVGLPWGEYTRDDLNLRRAQRVLDHDHYGMEKVKERILEHMAVLSLRGDLKSPIICLYGPPGVGKTSLGKSIAAALRRKYVRISLGGLHDESEIRGHRRTYVGAMPGRIIKSIQKAIPVHIH